MKPMAFSLTRTLLVSLLLFTPFGLSACGSDQSQAALGCATAASPCLSGKAVVSLQTSRGEVVVELNGADAPLTAGNFVDLVRRGTYNNTVFHRVVNQPTPFVVQGGDPQSATPGVSPELFGTGSFLDPSTGQTRFIPLELGLKGKAIPRYGEQLTDPAEASQLRLLHERGAIAMARSEDPNSANAQFYVALRPLPELDGRYAVFGRVVKGMEVVDRIQQGDKLVKANVIEGGTLVKGQP